MTALHQLVRGSRIGDARGRLRSGGFSIERCRAGRTRRSSVRQDRADRSRAVTPARTRCAEPLQAAGKSETLDRYAADYPQGPHDQPQSMCPAFGSLRVGLRMRRTATILSGSACCVYGLTFTSHFYGARRTVGYVPFNSETLVTGKLFEDIREAVYKIAESGRLRRHRHHQSLRADGVGRAAATAAERDQRRPHHRHRRAGLRRADPRRSQGRAGRRDAEICARGSRAGAGAGATRRSQQPADRDVARRDVSGRSGRHRHDAGADGPCRRSGGADARMARTICGARLRRGRRDSSILHGVGPRVRNRRPTDHRLGAGRP